MSGVGTTYVTLLPLHALVVLTPDGSAADVGWLNAAAAMSVLPRLTHAFAIAVEAPRWKPKIL